MTANAPLVSVVLPVHNGMPYLPGTIDSLRAQTMQNFEVIVIDDGSTDDSPAYLKSLGDDRFRYFRIDRAGIANALNFGIEQSRSELIARIDADDVAYPQRLAQQYQEFAQEDSLVLMGSGFDIIDHNGAIVGHGDCQTSDLASRWYLLFTAAFCHPAVMFRRAAALSTGGYDPACPVAQDYDLWTRIASCGKIGNLSDRLVQKRDNPSSWGAQNNSQQRLKAASIAARYSQSLGIDCHPKAFEELHTFLWSEFRPEVSTLKDLGVAFRTATCHFQRSPALPLEHAELSDAILYIQGRLRERCYEVARNTFPHPVNVVNWISAAKAFDPRSDGIGTLLFRKLCQLCRAA